MIKIIKGENMKESILYIILMIAWLIVGITMIATGPTSFSYGCLLVCYLSELFMNYLNAKDKDHDDWGGLML